jgi:hypothetical protein
MRATPERQSMRAVGKIVGLTEKPRMNLQEQIGALHAGVDQLLQAAAARPSRTAEAASAHPTDANSSDAEGAVPTPAQDTPATASATTALASAQASAAADAAAAVEEKVEAVQAAEPAEAPQSAPATHTLKIDRPSQNQITMTIDGKTVLLNPLQVGELIERLANVRASMQPEPPPDLPPGWRFVSTRNPAMAVQKQSNGDRLLVLRHTGHGWVPFTFTPDMVVQMYMMLTQR